MSKMMAKEAFDALFKKDISAICFCQSKTVVHKSANSFQFSKCDDCGDTYANLESKYKAKIANFTKEENAAVAKAKADAAAKAAKGTPGTGSSGGSGGSGTPPITHPYPSGINGTMKQAFIDYVYPTYHAEPEPFDDEEADIGKVMEHETLQLVSAKYESLPTASAERRELKQKIVSKNGDSTEMVAAIKDIITA